MRQQGGLAGGISSAQTLQTSSRSVRSARCNFRHIDPFVVIKVLLPPRTAQLYAVLLKAELNELAKERDASWERVLDIRRLKDRMIRKCQRLAQTYSSSNPGSRVPFLTLHAPHDFRLKEMEKWIRDQDGSDVLFKKSNGHPDGHKSRSAVWCDNCARQASHHHHTVSHRRSSSHVAHANTTHPRRSSSSRTHKSSSLRHRNFIEEDFVDGRSPSSPSASLLPLRESESQHVRVQGAQVHQRIHEHSSTKESSQSRHFSARQLDVEQEHLHLHASEHHQNASVEEGVFVEESKSHQRKRDMHVIQEERESSNLSILENHQESGLYGRAVASPVPLPVPYNGSMSSVFQDMVTSPVYADYPDTGSEQEQRLLTEGSRSPPSEEESVGDSLAPPGTLRRRSSLKRSNSDLRLNMAYSTKTVSWAMDRDWTQKMAKYQAAVEDVGFIGELSSIVSQTSA